MILVVGATGLLGSQICRQLRAGGKAVRALVRAGSDRSRVGSLQAMGAQLATGDLKDPDSLVAACDGATTVISTATAIFPREPGDSIAAVDRDGAMGLVDAASRAGSRHLIYVSFSGNVGTQDPLTTAKRTVERHLRASGLAHTILRPEPFMEVWLGPPFGFDPASGKVRVLGTGEQRVSWIALADVAKFAVVCVDDPAAHDTTIELGGPEALSPLEVVRIAEEIGGRPISVELVPTEALQRQKAEATSPTDASFAELMLHVATAGDVVDMSDTLDRFPVQLTPVCDYVRRVLAA